MIGELYYEALLRSGRDTEENLVCALELGWTSQQFRHWVETGEFDVQQES